MLLRFLRFLFESCIGVSFVSSFGIELDICESSISTSTASTSTSALALASSCGDDVDGGFNSIRIELLSLLLLLLLH